MSAEFELLPEFELSSEFEFENEANGSNSDYIKWIQSSLNKILALRLDEDGVIGQNTRSAIRSFQSRSGLTADGIVGSNTEAALIQAGAIKPPGYSGNVSMGSNTSSSTPTVTPKPCITPFASQLPKHLEPKLVACINKIVPSIDTLYLFEKTLQANWGPIWIKKLNTDLKTFLTYLYPNVNLTIELWRFVTIPGGDMRTLLVPLSKYLKAKSAGEFTVSIIAPIISQPTIEKISGTSLTNFVSSAGPLTSINHSYYFHVYATFPADVKNNFRQLEWANIDKFTFNDSALTAAQKQSLKLTVRDIVESWVSTSEKRYTKITLEGHTDSRGTEKYNVELGKKRAQVAAEFIKAEIFNLAPQYYLDPSKMNIEYEIVSYGETKPISTKNPIIHEFNRRVEITLHSTPVTVNTPLVLQDVLTRCLAILNARKNALNTNYYKSIHCLLTTMLRPGVDDRYLSGQATLDVFNTNKFPRKDEWFRLRFFFTNQGFFSTQRPDSDIFQSLISIDQTIRDSVNEIERKINSHNAVFPLPLPKAFDALAKWVSKQAKSKDSIYNCY